MKPKISSITVMSNIKPSSLNRPFVSVFFSRVEQSNKIRFDPTPSSLYRVMRWQAITLIAQRKAEVRR